MPLCFGASRSVRQSTKHHCAQCASDVHTFWPVMTHSSPSSSARVCDVGEVGAGVGLGVALAPDLGARAGCRAGTGASARRCRSARSSGRAALRRRCRPGPAHRRARTPRRRSPARAATRRGRRTPPASQPDPAAAAELLLPRPGAPRSTRARRRGRRGPRTAANASLEPIGEPRARLGAEALVLGGEAQVQDRHGTSARRLPGAPAVPVGCAADRSRWSDLDVDGIAVVTGAEAGDRAGGCDRACGAGLRHRRDDARRRRRRGLRPKRARGRAARRPARRQRRSTMDLPDGSARAREQRGRREREPAPRGDARRRRGARSSRPTCSGWSR